MAKALEVEFEFGFVSYYNQTGQINSRLVGRTFKDSDFAQTYLDIENVISIIFRLLESKLMMLLKNLVKIQSLRFKERKSLSIFALIQIKNVHSCLPLEKQRIELLTNTSSK